jgi:hypothetical protein
MRTTIALILIALSLGACGSYQRIGSSDPIYKRFTPQTDYTLPADFTVYPYTLAYRYAASCYAKYQCTYLADDRFYYLVPDYGVTPTLYVRQAATFIVDGRTGELLKGQDKLPKSAP